jgi:acetyltransferase-like isoleucine patch superfamily enzyme
MSNSIIYDNVIIGINVSIGDFCIIGEPPAGKIPGEIKTIIGDNAVIRSHTVIYAGNTIGSNFSTGHHVVIRENNKIGDNVSIGTLSCVEHDVIIEDDARIHSQAFIPEFSKLGKNSWIGPNVVITNARYPKSKNVKQNLAGAVLEENAKIGANTTLLPGVRIGKDSLVGAGSVVTKDIPPRKIAVGNPSRIIKDIDDIKEYRG